MTRYLVWAALAYAVFLVVQALLVAFVADVGPWTIDGGRTAATVATATAVAPALIVDVALLAAFGVVHSAMARTGFKRRAARWLPAPAERATYVLVASAQLTAIVVGWQPVTPIVWEVAGWARAVVWGLFGLGLVGVTAAGMAIDHLALYGIRQALPGAAAVGPESLVLSGMYRWVRHPLQASLLVVFLAAPTMTIGHLLFAATMGAYAWIGTTFEERALVRQFGEAYRAYQRRVGRLWPRLWPRAS